MSETPEYLKYSTMKEHLEGQLRKHVNEAIEKAKNDTIRHFHGQEHDWKEVESTIQTKHENLQRLFGENRIIIAGVLREIADTFKQRPSE